MVDELKFPWYEYNMKDSKINFVHDLIWLRWTSFKEIILKVFQITWVWNGIWTCHTNNKT